MEGTASRIREPRDTRRRQRRQWGFELEAFPRTRIAVRSAGQRRPCRSTSALDCIERGCDRIFVSQGGAFLDARIELEVSQA